MDYRLYKSKFENGKAGFSFYAFIEEKSNFKAKNICETYANNCSCKKGFITFAPS